MFPSMCSGSRIKIVFSLISVPVILSGCLMTALPNQDYGVNPIRIESVKDFGVSEEEITLIPKNTAFKNLGANTKQVKDVFSSAGSYGTHGFCSFSRGGVSGYPYRDTFFEAKKVILPMQGNAPQAEFATYEINVASKDGMFRCKSAMTTMEELQKIGVSLMVLGSKKVNTF